MKGNLLRISAVALCVVAIGFMGVASAKSVYLVADHHANPTGINAYNIGPGGYPLAYQDTYFVAYNGIGASGLAIFNDPDGDGFNDDAQIFVTYESSNKVEVFLAEDFTYIGTILASGARDLAGIVVDQEKALVYTVDRFTNNLYVYDAVTFAPQGTLPIILPELSYSYGAMGLAMDEGRDWLFVTDNTAVVNYYDTNTWSHVGAITTHSVYGGGLAYDEELQIIYTGGAWYSDNRLCKYDMTTNVATYLDLSQQVYRMGAMGLAVDLDTNLLYVTTGYGGDDLRVYDSDLNQVYLYPDTEGWIRNPAGIAIANATYNPLNLTKTDDVEECVYPNQQITYTLCFDNLDNEIAVPEASIVDDLPDYNTFVSATGPYTYPWDGWYAGQYHTGAVKWDFGDLPPADPGDCVTLTTRVAGDAPWEGSFVNYATIHAVPPYPAGLPTTVSVETHICEEPPCQPDPSSQGYWHRQCLGLPESEGGIDPGRNGRGPQEPTEPLFVEELMPCAEARLEALGFYGMGTCEGMDAVPASDPCERAKKQFTALLLNVCSDRLQETCQVETESCSSTTLGELVEEIADLIHGGYCKEAADCAAAANEGDAIVLGGLESDGFAPPELAEAPDVITPDLRPFRFLPGQTLREDGILKVRLGFKDTGKRHFLVPAGYFRDQGIAPVGEPYYFVPYRFDPTAPEGAGKVEVRDDDRERRRQTVIED